jgi:hypothetical protein
MRALFNKDISTGLVPVSDTYSSIGPSDTWHIKNLAPERPKPVCYVLKPSTCKDEIYAMVANGTAAVKDYIVLEGDAAMAEPGKISSGDTDTQRVLVEEL